jgi:YD repeat-containing protein
MNKNAEDERANRTVRVTATGTQDMTVEYTQLDQTKGISNGDSNSDT